VSRYRVVVGIALEYDVDAETEHEIRALVAATRAAGLDLTGEGQLWAGPDVVSVELIE
jgi:hypothetical protein